MSAIVLLLIGICGAPAMLMATMFAARALRRRRNPPPAAPQALLRRALSRREIEVHYQPVFEADGNLAGAEALIRWRHPEVGLIGPGAILHGVDDGPELHALTVFVLEDATRTLARLRRVGADVAYLGINVPASVLEDERFPEMVEAQLRSIGISGAGLVLELTETSAVRSWEAVKVAIDRLRPLGIRLALDDFGRGHANLPALGTSNADIVKLDKALLDEVLSNERSKEIVDSVIRLAGSLRMEIVAEGIEDLHVLEWLMDQPIAYFQGHALGCAQPIDELIDGLYRPVPLPSLAGLPRSERGSIALPAIIALALGLGAFASSAVAWQQWSDARSVATRWTAASDRLERSYLNLVVLSHRSAAAHVVQGRTSFAAAESDLIAVDGLELLAALDAAHVVDGQSGELERANWMADEARQMYAEGDWSGATESVITVVAPAVRRYLDEANGPDSAGRAAGELSQLLYERVALVSRARFSLGLDPIDNPRFAALPVLTENSADPLAAWMARPSHDEVLPIKKNSTNSRRVAALEAIWPHLINPTVDGVSSIDLEQMQADSFALQLAIDHHIETHDLPGWTPRSSMRPEIPPAAWLTTGSLPPAIFLVGIGAAFAAAIDRRHKASRRRHPAAMLRR